jgi:hypothetical protein
MQIALSLLPFLLVLLSAGCSDEPVSYSEPVGINLKVKSSETTTGTVANEKGINTESSNPYGAFVANARRQLGADPAEIDVARVEILLGASSTGVVTLGEVFDGTVDVLFKMNDTDNSYPVASGTVTTATTSGPIPLATVFDAGEVSSIDHEKMTGGSFKVVARGATAATFATKGAEAELQITLTFSAYE